MLFLLFLCFLVVLLYGSLQQIAILSTSSSSTKQLYATQKCDWKVSILIFVQEKGKNTEKSSKTTKVLYFTEILGIYQYHLLQSWNKKIEEFLPIDGLWIILDYRKNVISGRGCN